MKKLLIAAVAALLMTSCEKERMLNEPGNLVQKTVDQDPGLPSIAVNGVLLHAEAFGHPDSTIIVVLHGGPGGDYRYMLNCTDLADNGYRVVFYDQRGSGLSQRMPHDSYTDLGSRAVDIMYDELSGVIAHYRTHASQKVYLIGQSWGAMLASGYAGRYPNTIQGLVVAEPGGLKWDDVEEYVAESRSFKLWSEMLNDVTYLDQFITGKEDQHEILDYKLAMLASKNDITGEDNTQPGSGWRSGAVVNTALFEVGSDYKTDFSEGLNTFHVPVLFFYSQLNKAYPDSWAHKISGSFYNVTLNKVQGVGHQGMFTEQQPWNQVTMPAILNYFNSL